MKIIPYSYRYADAVLNHRAFKKSKDEVLRALAGIDVVLLDPDEPNSKKGGVKKRSRNGAPARFLPVNQKALNVALDESFRRMPGWTLQPRITDPAKKEGPKTGLKGDYKKDRLQVVNAV